MEGGYNVTDEVRARIERKRNKVREKYGFSMDVRNNGGTLQGVEIYLSLDKDSVMSGLAALLN